DHAGELHIQDTDPMAEKGAEVLGGVGLVIGLLSPPLLMTTVIGAAIGGGLGELADQEVESKIEQLAGETIPFGGAGLIVAYPRSAADGVDRAVTRAAKKTVGEAEGKRVKALKKAVADAQQKMKQPGG